MVQVINKMDVLSFVSYLIITCSAEVAINDKQYSTLWVENNYLSKNRNINELFPFKRQENKAEN